MSFAGTFVGWMDDGIFAGKSRSSIFVLSRDRDLSPGPYVMSEFELNDASGRGVSETGGSLQSLTLEVSRDGFIGSYPYIAWTEASTPMPSRSNGSNVYLRVTQPGLQSVDDQFLGRKHHGAAGNVLDNDISLFGEVEGFLATFDGRSMPEDRPLEFTSALGARVLAQSNGTVQYIAQGFAAFRSLKRGEFLKESFVYRVDNFVNQAEGIVEFIIYGDNKWHNAGRNLDVNGDGIISPLDVLRIINDVNALGSRALDDLGPVGNFFPDVNDDGFISASDVLLVINFLNSGNQSGEGEVAPRIQASESRTASLTANGWPIDNTDFLYNEFQGESARRRKRTCG